MTTLTAGGDADALHTHASAGGGGRIGYLGVTTQVRAADVGLPLMNKDCATTYGAARMCTLSQVLDSYPAPSPGAEAWIYWDPGAHTDHMILNRYGTSIVFTHKPSLSAAGKKWDQMKIPEAHMRNCTQTESTGPFTTTDIIMFGQSSGQYYNELRALSVGGEGGVRRVDCDQEFVTACCGPL